MRRNDSLHQLLGPNNVAHAPASSVERFANGANGKCLCCYFRVEGGRPEELLIVGGVLIDFV